ncbi:Protein GLUTAMINE DUMPER 3 [Raphanus sativus]|uniref:Protein GLUTAMINE DUMPER 3 n=1 Tax=Raphanus sativus TaxID=3726 RepID=A0A6J0L4I1_RAPSA|nr:protein GLUTAMINE DUMPER 3 [Raphanus sativus]KAJ4875278.1 Protein GLUTAMINE DUMPER 3 [Raphanus sativus]
MEGRQYYAPRENIDGNRTAMGGPHSPWHSPIPYLFGGLAAMLGLIAFALLILACSYWRLSGYLDSEENQSRDRDLEAGDAKPEKAVALPEKFLVIMAGDVNPTYLATPVEKTCTSDGEDGDDEVDGNDQVVQKSSDSNSATH